LQKPVIKKNFYKKIVQKFLKYTFLKIRFLVSIQKAKGYQNLTTESGPKQRFSLLREKAFSTKARF